MKKEEAIKHLEFLKIAAEIQAKPERVETEALDMAIEVLKGTKAFCEIRYDKDELERLVYEAKEEIKTGIIAVFIDDLKEIYEKLWDVKISAPNIIEHGEHYKQIQDITADVEEKLKKYQEAGREET
jgi:hypothetical protein